MYSDNLVASAKFLGSGIKQETFYTYSPKIGKAYEISLTTDLKTLCKTLLTFCGDNNTPFHYS